MELADWRFSNDHDSLPRTQVVPTNGELVVAYLSWLETTRGRSPQTLRSYLSTLTAWVEWNGVLSLLDAERSEMERFMERRRTRRGQGRMGSPATRKREASCLRAFYKWLVDEQLLATSPAGNLVGPTVHNINPRPVDEGQWLTVWGSELTDGERLMLGLGFFCGLRRHEMVRLQTGQITNTRLIDFTRKGGGEHTLPWAEMVGVLGDKLPDVVGETDSFITAMHQARSMDGDVLPWVTGGDPQSINKRLYQIQRRLGWPETSWFTPHQLRHSCATNMLRAGVPLHLVANLLNHSNPSITMRYVRAGGAELREWRKGHSNGS